MTTQLKTMHPFPARMGPDLAIDRLRRLKPASIVVDPMAGSGTVLRHAAEFGHVAYGYDMDPLAVLMARVWTTPVEQKAIDRQYAKLTSVMSNADDAPCLPWIDADEETSDFVKFWFGKSQRSDLRRIAYGLSILEGRRWSAENRAALDVLRLSLSRIIVTKESGASLARDISHSRPHRVATRTAYQVLPGFERSVRQLKRKLADQRPPGNVTVALGDARRMAKMADGFADAVLTSPPYLNAIDYLRGHRMALVWLGYRLGTLRRIRSDSVGAERSLHHSLPEGEFDDIRESLGEIDRLPPREGKIVERYVSDMVLLMAEISRVLKRDGRAFLVVGNSCLRNVFINNANGFVAAGRRAGLRLTRRSERELPMRKRYLPIPKDRQDPLGGRMRTETVLTFKHN